MLVMRKVLWYGPTKIQAQEIGSEGAEARAEVGTDDLGLGLHGIRAFY